MATDGRRILFNPEFVHSLQPEELEAVLAHEVLHCALGHHPRREMVVYCGCDGVAGRGRA
jgi:predicted metal-dependent peptidase